MGKISILSEVCFLACFAVPLSAPAQLQLLVDQVGYDVNAPKIALLEATGDDQAELRAAPRFDVVDVATGKWVFSGTVSTPEKVMNWGDRLFSKLDFSAVHEPGHYRLQLQTPDGPITTAAFAVDNNVLERSTLSNVIFYFKGQRSTGDYNRADSHLRNPEGPGYVDVRGGWYDASGDYGIHFSHQNPTSYFNPQQVPLVAWSLLSSYGQLKLRDNGDFSEYEHRLLDEGLFGADFIVRMKRPNGAFFESISAPGPHKLAADREIGNPNWRTQIKTDANASTTHVVAAAGRHPYQTSFRAGGGVAIAALALASTLPEHGEFSQAQYLDAAESAFAFLQQHNTELLNDGKENILDDYCALMASTELFHATQKAQYRDAAESRATRLMNRLTSADGFRDYWRADGATRPFFHPADAGLPVISLLQYASLVATASQKAQVLQVVRRSLEFELRTTDAVSNPFGYARQLVRMGDGTVRPAFFFPHDTEAAPWWQGENARLASLASAARLAEPFFSEDPAFQGRLRGYAWNQLHWILGRNPFNSSMLMGSGENNAQYMFFRSYRYTSAPGSIINGVTAASNDEDGIAFNEGFAVTRKDEDWRWTEEWLPHAAWFLYAISLPHDEPHH